MKVEAFRIQMLRSVSNKIPGWALLFNGHNPALREYCWKLCMPITQKWEYFFVPAENVAASCIPRDTQEILDYWASMRQVLEHARDFAPMSGDLSPIDPDERAIFGVRVMEPNPCFPLVVKGRTKVSPFYGDLYNNV